MQMVKKALIACGLAGHGASIRLTTKNRGLLGNHGGQFWPLHDCALHSYVNSNSQKCLPDPYRYIVGDSNLHGVFLQEFPNNEDPKCSIRMDLYTSVDGIAAMNRLKTCQQMPNEAKCRSLTDVCVWDPTGRIAQKAALIAQKAAKDKLQKTVLQRASVKCDNNDPNHLQPQECNILNYFHEINGSIARVQQQNQKFATVMRCLVNSLNPTKLADLTTQNDFYNKLHAVIQSPKNICTDDALAAAKIAFRADTKKVITAYLAQSVQFENYNKVLMNAMYQLIFNRLYTDQTPGNGGLRSQHMEVLLTEGHQLRQFLSQQIGLQQNHLTPGRDAWVRNLAQKKGTVMLSMIKPNAINGYQYEAHGLWENSPPNAPLTTCRNKDMGACGLVKDRSGANLCQWNNGSCTANGNYLSVAYDNNDWNSGQLPRINKTKFTTGHDLNPWRFPFEHSVVGNTHKARFDGSLDSYAVQASKQMIHEAMKHGVKLGFGAQNTVDVKGYAKRVADVLEHWNTSWRTNPDWTKKANDTGNELRINMVYVGDEATFKAGGQTQPWMWQPTNDNTTFKADKFAAV